MNWIVKNWPSVFLLLAGIVACIATFYSSKGDQEQKDLIQDLGEQNIKLSEGIKDLNRINNEIGTRVERLTNAHTDLLKDNLLISQQNKRLMRDIQSLTQQSKELIYSINKTTSYDAAQNLQTGELLMQFKSTFKEDDQINVLYGSNTESYTISQIEQGSGKFLTTSDTDPSNIGFDSGKILLNLVVYDLKGTLIAEIKDNYWRPNKLFSGKFNYDENGFEVIDNQGYVAVNIDFIGKNIISIQGVFTRFDQNVVFVIGKAGFMKVGLHEPDANFNQYRKDMQVKQLFEYTGKDWLHKRIKR